MDDSLRNAVRALAGGGMAEFEDDQLLAVDSACLAEIERRGLEPAAHTALLRALVDRVDSFARREAEFVLEQQSRGVRILDEDHDGALIDHNTGELLPLEWDESEPHADIQVLWNQFHDGEGRAMGERPLTPWLLPVLGKVLWEAICEELDDRESPTADAIRAHLNQ